jgi:hypothetical protein
VAAGDGASYMAALDRWARSTWAAYAQLHAIARRWVGEAAT